MLHLNLSLSQTGMTCIMTPPHSYLTRHACFHVKVAGYELSVRVRVSAEEKNPDDQNKERRQTLCRGGRSSLGILGKCTGRDWNLLVLWSGLRLCLLLFYKQGFSEFHTCQSNSLMELMGIPLQVARIVLCAVSTYRVCRSLWPQVC